MQLAESKEGGWVYTAHDPGVQNGNSGSITGAAALANRARRFCRHAVRHSPVARWLLPVAHSPIDTAGSGGRKMRYNKPLKATYETAGAGAT